jgi:hypothetical protein
MPTNDLSRKEQARLLRRAAYQKAKARRATDPRFIAMKEAMKKQRREAYQAAKQRKKTAAKARQAETRTVREAAMEELVTAGIILN